MDVCARDRRASDLLALANYLKALTQGATTYNYTYNGDGARLKQLAGTTATTYTLDLAAGLVQVLAQQQAGTTTQYLYGAGRIGERTPGTVAYHLADALGSVRQLADGTGALTLVRGYEPYGEVLNTAGTGTSMYGFTGEPRDATGLEYLRARYYAPSQGRFINEDTSKQEANLYLYAGANPIMNTDPTGLWRFRGLRGDEEKAIEDAWYRVDSSNRHVEYSIPLTDDRQTWSRVDMLDAPSARQFANSQAGNVYEIEPIYLVAKPIAAKAVGSGQAWENVLLLNTAARQGRLKGPESTF